ncbi:MAG: hypothetical protein AAB849_01400 [Patescibacteria group bacterium]
MKGWDLETALEKKSIVVIPASLRQAGASGNPALLFFFKTVIHKYDLTKNFNLLNYNQC